MTRSIRDFVEAAGFIPPSDSHPAYWPFTSRLRPDQWFEVTRLYAAMGGMSNVRSHYDSGFEALAHAGALPDSVQITARGAKCLARNGHVCLSLNKRAIDDWLSRHNIAHEKEPRYPFHTKLHVTSRRADFRVGDYWIEYFGLAGNEGYDEKVRQKIQLAKELELKLIAIYPWQMSDLDRVLAVLLAHSEGNNVAI